MLAVLLVLVASNPAAERQPMSLVTAGASVSASPASATCATGQWCTPLPRFEVYARTGFPAGESAFIGPVLRVGLGVPEPAVQTGRQTTATVVRTSMSAAAGAWWRWRTDSNLVGVGAALGVRLENGDPSATQLATGGALEGSPEASVSAFSSWGRFSIEAGLAMSFHRAVFVSGMHGDTALSPVVTPHLGLGLALDRDGDSVVPGVSLGMESFAGRDVPFTLLGTVDLSSRRWAGPLELRPFLRGLVPLGALMLWPPRVLTIWSSAGDMTGFAGVGPGLAATWWRGTLGVGGAAAGYLLVRTGTQFGEGGAGARFAAEVTATGRVKWAAGRQDASLDLGVFLMTPPAPRTTGTPLPLLMSPAVRLAWSLHL